MFISLPQPASIFYAWDNSDVFARFIILILFAISAFCWSIMVDKGLIMRKLTRTNQLFMKNFKRSNRLFALSTEANSTVASLYKAAIQEVAIIMGCPANQPELMLNQGKLVRQLSEEEIAKVSTTMDLTISTEMTKLQKYLNILGTSVSISPFLGLLGTVWGVMMSFCAMAQKGRPDISAIAPGISGALLTTVIGLLVAIPSVIGYNIITSNIRNLTSEMEDFVEDFTARLKLLNQDK